jgi:hypothetical protein
LGLHRNLGGPALSTRMKATGVPGESPKRPGSRPGIGVGQSEYGCDAWYRRARNTSRRNGWQEVGAPRSTAEAGERPARGRTPWREGGVGSQNRFLGKTSDASKSRPCLNETGADSHAGESIVHSQPRRR